MKNMNMLIVTKCKRCGKEISSLAKPIHSSLTTMHKYQGICQRCMTNEEMIEMMMDMNNDIKEKA